MASIHLNKFNELTYGILLPPHSYMNFWTFSARLSIMLQINHLR
jgi:hypothetical protein